MGGTTKKVSTTPEEIMPLRYSIVDALMSGNVRNPAGNMGNNVYNQSWMNSQRMNSPTGGTGARPPMPMSMGGGFGSMGGMNPTQWASYFRNRQPAQGPEGASNDFLDMLNSGIFAQGPSLDSFADPNGALFSGVRGGYEDMFSQNRQLALAQAKESAGNLTGSGYETGLGNVVNRSLGEQNALMSQILTQLAMTQYGQENANSQNNASRFLQMLMSMSGGGVGPMEVVQSGGAGAILGPLMGLAGGYFGGPAGAAAGAAAGKAG